MLVLFVGWSIFFIYVLLRFRRGAHPNADYRGVRGGWSNWVEGGVLVAEIVLLAFFSIPFWTRNVDAAPPPENEATVVRVVAEQFAWNVHYPGADGVFGRTDIRLVSPDNPLGLDRNEAVGKDDLVVNGRLNLPVGKPVISESSPDKELMNSSVGARASRRYSEKMSLRMVLALLLTLFLPHGASAETTPHLRILDGQLKSLFEYGLTQSPTLRALADKVEAASILVFVEGDIRMPERLGARLQFVTNVDGVRYVRVDINCMLAPRRQIALLAHELQHALEIAERPEVVDTEAMESMYEDIGFQSFDDGRHRGFETHAALDVQETVDRELGGRAPRPLATY